MGSWILYCLTVYNHVLHLKWPLWKPNCSTKSLSSSSAVNRRPHFLLFLKTGRGGVIHSHLCTLSFERENPVVPVSSENSFRRQSRRSKAACSLPWKIKEKTASLNHHKKMYHSVPLFSLRGQMLVKGFVWRSTRVYVAGHISQQGWIWIWFHVKVQIYL